MKQIEMYKMGRICLKKKIKRKCQTLMKVEKNCVFDITMTTEMLRASPLRNSRDWKLTKEMEWELKEWLKEGITMGPSSRDTRDLYSRFWYFSRLLRFAITSISYRCGSSLLVYFWWRWLERYGNIECWINLNFYLL